MTETTTSDLDAQIKKLEEKLNDLLDKVQKAQVAPQEAEQSIESTHPTRSGGRKSRQEILAEYEKGYLARLEENALAEEEIRRKAAKLEAKEKISQSNSTRGTLPKGY